MSSLQILSILFLCVQASDQEGQRTECLSDIYMTCDGQRWSEGTGNEYDECVQKHNGYLTDYSTPPTRSDCTGGVPCSYCEAVDLTDCDCYCYDDCDGAYVTGMRVLGGLLTAVACFIVIFWAIKQKENKSIANRFRIKQMSTTEIKDNMNTLIDSNVIVNMSDRPYFGVIAEIKDENDEILFKIAFSNKDKDDEWVKKDIVDICGNKNKEIKDETTWKFYLGCVVCLVCTIFAIIFYYDPLAFYPKKNDTSQEEKMKDWGIGFLVFGCIGACCFCICIILTFVQKKMDKEREEKLNSDIEMNTMQQTDQNESNYKIEKEEDEEGHIPMSVWIIRTVVVGVCCTILLVIGIIMVGFQDAFD